jgi:hypothetical protein
MRRTKTLLVCMPVALSLAACGSSNPTTSTATSASPDASVSSPAGSTTTAGSTTKPETGGTTSQPSAAATVANPTGEPSTWPGVCELVTKASAKRVVPNLTVASNPSEDVCSYAKVAAGQYEEDPAGVNVIITRTTNASTMLKNVEAANEEEKQFGNQDNHFERVEGLGDAAACVATKKDAQSVAAVTFERGDASVKVEAIVAGGKDASCAELITLAREANARLP